MKSQLTIIAFLSTLTASFATLYTTNWNSGFANGQVIPDNNLSGWADSRTVNTLPAGTFNGIYVDLNISGGWNGDLYAYLVHDTGFTVLLDRVGTGVSGVSVYGYGDAGMNVILGATGSSIHSYGGHTTFSSAPGGNYAADATSGSLASFLNTNPNGTWTLFIADKSSGGISTVQSWGLQMDIVAVPEVETWIAAALAGAFGAFWVNRQIWGHKGPQAHPLS
jgi:subtilisin-like proprotein convertase family protein